MRSATRQASSEHADEPVQGAGDKERKTARTCEAVSMMVRAFCPLHCSAQANKYNRGPPRELQRDSGSEATKPSDHSWRRLMDDSHRNWWHPNERKNQCEASRLLHKRISMPEELAKAAHGQASDWDWEWVLEYSEADETGSSTDEEGWILKAAGITLQGVARRWSL
ncbi:hypothetical protein NM208_g10803 [Fusarium decemcellulare]|uniref:Uncharacterized protein n=1 Tax=Fusarium decemcellulare TaxID=57161 RepID=A0ACC1RWK4_9HYPO|nr:hypothetical protein NM208_g10803 [Fusarium decemcellulare]